MWGATALAQEQVCAGALRVEEWRDAMDGVDKAIADGNGTLADRILDDVHDALRCLDVVVDPADVGRLARQTSLVAFYEQDHNEVERWGLLARETLGGTPWPDALPAPTRYHQVIAETPDRGRSGPEDRGLIPPKGGAVLIDGRLAKRARATVSVPHLVQVADKEGVLLSTHWQDGAAFPDSLLGEISVIRAPDWYVAPAKPPPPAEHEGRDDAPTLSFNPELAARDCPWRGKPRKVEVGKNTIQVNRKTFPIKTDAEHLAFQKVLRSCGEFRAARRFDRWQLSRQGLPTDAGKHKDRMIEALLTDEPPRKRDR